MGKKQRKKKQRMANRAEPLHCAAYHVSFPRALVSVSLNLLTQFRHMSHGKRRKKKFKKNYYQQQITESCREGGELKSLGAVSNNSRDSYLFDGWKSQRLGERSMEFQNKIIGKQLHSWMVVELVWMEVDNFSWFENGRLSCHRPN